MGVPITTRLDADTASALDRAVRQGAGPTRSAVVAHAVREWLARHSEDAIVESYRRAYAQPDADHDELIAKVGSYSAALGLDESER